MRTSASKLRAPRSRHLDHADAVADLDLGAIFRRQALNPLQDAIGDFALGRHRPAALRACLLMAEIDRVDADFGETVADEVADRERLLPLQRVAGVSFCAALIARLDE